MQAWKKALGRHENLCGVGGGGLALLAEIGKKMSALRTAVRAFAGQFQAPLNCDWDATADGLVTNQSSLCARSGSGLCHRAEIALKCKENLRFLHAESYSAAEVFARPSALVCETRFPVARARGRDAAHADVNRNAEETRRAGARMCF